MKESNFFLEYSSKHSSNTITENFFLAIRHFNHVLKNHTNDEPQTCDSSRVCHMDDAISGDIAKAARVVSKCAFKLAGTGQPRRPKSDATGSHDWLSHMAMRALSSYKNVR